MFVELRIAQRTICDLVLCGGVPPERHSVQNRELAEVVLRSLEQAENLNLTSADLIVVRWCYIHHLPVETICDNFRTLAVRHDV